MNTLPPEPNVVPDPGIPRVQRWSATACAFGIDYSSELMDRVRLKAVESFHVLPHGGLEVGGLLFGRVYPNARTPLRIELTAERPILCAHHNGPEFSLTEEERGQITAQLERTRLDPEIAAFSVLGFWVSHSRGELALSKADMEIYNLFPNAWQVVLILKPQAGLPTRATFIFRDNNRICPPDEQHEFYADPHLKPVSRASEPSQTPAKYQPIPRERRVAIPREEPPVGKTVTLSQLAFLITVAMLIGASLTYGLLLWGKRVAGGRPEQINLELFPNATGVLVHWNPQAADIQSAHRADLLISDGSKVTAIPLTPALLKRGFVTYDSQPNQLSVTLIVVAQNGRVQRFGGRYWPAPALAPFR